MRLLVMTLLTYRVVGKSQGSENHWTVTGRLLCDVVNMSFSLWPDIFNSNLGQLLMTKSKEENNN